MALGAKIDCCDAMAVLLLIAVLLQWTAAVSLCPQRCRSRSAVGYQYFWSYLSRQQPLLHSTPHFTPIYILCETRFALVDHVVDHASGHVERAFLLLTSNVRPARFAQPALLQVERDGRAKQRHCAGTDICL